MNTTSSLTSTERKAFNAIKKNLKKNSRAKKELTAQEYYTNCMPLLKFFKEIREEDGNFTVALGLNSVENGGTIGSSANGRCTLWVNYVDEVDGPQEDNWTFSEKLSKRILDLHGDKDYRSLENGGYLAVTDCVPLLIKAFVGTHKKTKATGIAI